MRYLAIDLGVKRTGLAVGDDRTGVASHVGEGLLDQPVHRDPDAGGKVAQRGIDGQLDGEHGREYEPDALVVGLPVNMDGSEGDAARDVRREADTIATALTLPLHLVDERLTSDAADRLLRGRDLTRRARKARQDAIAAAIICQAHLDRVRLQPDDPPSA